MELVDEIVAELELAVPKRWMTSKLQNLLTKYHEQNNTNDDSSSIRATKESSNFISKEKT